MNTKLFIILFILGNTQPHCLCGEMREVDDSKRTPADTDLADFFLFVDVFAQRFNAR